MLQHYSNVSYFSAKVDDACALWIVAKHLVAGAHQSHQTFQHTAARLLDVDKTPPFLFGREGA